jgi:hypothetical protein
MTDKVEVWAHRIHQEAGKTAKAVLDLLVSIDPAGFKNMTKIQREQVHERIAREVVETMGRLGTFVAAGAQDAIEATLVAVNIKGADDIKLTLEPKAGSNVHLVADNASKQVVVAFINQLAYETARDALVKQIHRDQTDWVATAEEERLSAEAKAEVSVTAQATGETNEGAEHHGESEEEGGQAAEVQGDSADAGDEGAGRQAGG